MKKLIASTVMGDYYEIELSEAKKKPVHYKKLDSKPDLTGYSIITSSSLYEKVNKDLNGFTIVVSIYKKDDSTKRKSKLIKTAVKLLKKCKCDGCSYERRLKRSKRQ